MDSTFSRVLRRKEVIKRVGLSASTLVRLQKAGKFPAHIMLSPLCAGFYEAEIEAWLAARRSVPEGLAGLPVRRVVSGKVST